MIMNLYRNIDRDKIQFDFILDHPDQLYFAEEVSELGGKIYFMPTFSGKNTYQIKRAWNSFFEEHPEYLEDKEKRASVPWDELIADDKESLGQRKLSSFLCPWK